MGAEHLSRALSMNRSLIMLRLWSSSIVFIALILVDNCIGDEGAEHIGG